MNGDECAQVCGACFFKYREQSLKHGPRILNIIIELVTFRALASLSVKYTVKCTVKTSLLTHSSLASPHASHSLHSSLRSLCAEAKGFSLSSCCACRLVSVSSSRRLIVSCSNVFHFSRLSVTGFAPPGVIFRI
jgi:hypothetical protein